MNRGLAGLGAFLPEGTTFNLPVPAPREPAILDPIRRKYFEMRDESSIHMGERLAREIGGNFRIQGTRAIMSKRGGTYIAAAVAMGTDCNDIDARLPVSLIKYAIPISPLNELEPICFTSINEGVRMDAAETASQSPMNNPPLTNAPQRVVCGETETNEFHRQADIYL